MPLPKEKAWFSVRRYGWGWGLPCRWQGWVVLVGFLAALIAGSWLIQKNVFLYIGYVFTIISVWCAICYWKGQPPKWRWGDGE